MTNPPYLPLGGHSGEQLPRGADGSIYAGDAGTAQDAGTLTRSSHWGCQKPKFSWASWKWRMVATLAKLVNTFLYKLGLIGDISNWLARSSTNISVGGLTLYTMGMQWRENWDFINEDSNVQPRRRWPPHFCILLVYNRNIPLWWLGTLRNLFWIDGWVLV